MSEKMSAEEIARLLEAVDESLRDGASPKALFISLSFYRELLMSHATLQREADGMREALEEISRMTKPIRTSHGLFSTTTQEPTKAAIRARAALNGSPQVEAEKGSDR